MLRLALVQCRRDWRAGELRLLGLALVIAVAGLTSVDFFTDRVRQLTEVQATELLAADLVIGAAEPFTPEFIKQAETLGLNTTLTVSFRSMAVAGDQLELAEVKAVQAGYPLRGQLQVTDELFAREYQTDAIPAPGTVWLDPRLLQALDVAVGAQVSLGAATLVAERVLTYEPDRGGDMFNIAPRLLMNLGDLEQSGLIAPGSRVTYRLLLAGDGAALRKFRALTEQYPAYDIRGIRDARPELRSALERSEQFLGLAVLVSIALAGLAIALAAQRYAVRHYDTCAIMRCFGAAPGLVVRLHVMQLLITALGGGAIGCVLGYLGQTGLALLLQDLVARPLPPPSPAPLATGLAAAVVTTLGFALPQILRLRHVSAMRVLRRDLAPLPLHSLSIYLPASGCLLLLALWQSGRELLFLYGCVALALTALSAWLMALLVIYCLHRWRGRLGPATRFGLSNVVRRGRLSATQILAISLGVTLLTLLALLRTDLLEDWRGRLPATTPNYFLINIQPQEVDAIREFLHARSGLSAQVHPLVRARLLSINGRTVNPEDYADERAQRFLRRTFNLSVAETLQNDNRLEQGEWWDTGSEGLFSFEKDFAETLGISPGDRLEFDIAGARVVGVVANTRRVDWDTFNVNFFVVASPATLSAYPTTYITSFYLPRTHRPVLNELVKNWPSVTVFDVDTILRQVRLVMEQVVRAVEFISGFTVLAGIIVLLAALQSTHAERRRETALLTTLGARRGQVLAGLLAEFTVLGLSAGVVAALNATVAQYLLAEYVFRMDFSFSPLVWLATPLLCTAITSGAGLAGTRKARSAPPMLTLRQS
ncbi:MAG: FtsX-like permease family protein [Gammaproteobacteria bacterium]|nr:FtsX-like permease family protein [Gammaproteobacteria bacterium]